jgi:uncharacterized membrane protein YeaQ/YmgE (transglycosylase-associated protein family)
MNIDVTADQVIMWLIIGALAGSLAGMLMKREKKGFGLFSNLLIGLIGALIGGFLLDLLNINLGLGKLTISFEDLIAAFAGSLIFLVILSFIKK